MLPLDAHPLLQQSYDVSQAIEACGASPALTAAVTLSSGLTKAISDLVADQCLAAPTCVPLDGLQPHEQRVVRELAQLDCRRAKLAAFSETAAFKGLPDQDRELLINQHECMSLLCRILLLRIQRFKPEAAPAVAASTHGMVSGDDFPLGKACDLSGEGGCEACQ